MLSVCASGPGHRASTGQDLRRSRVPQNTVLTAAFQVKISLCSDASLKHLKKQGKKICSLLKSQNKRDRGTANKPNNYPMHQTAAIISKSGTKLRN